MDPVHKVKKAISKAEKKKSLANARKKVEALQKREKEENSNGGEGSDPGIADKLKQALEEERMIESMEVDDPPGDDPDHHESVAGPMKSSHRADSLFVSDGEETLFAPNQPGKDESGLERATEGFIEHRSDTKYIVQFGPPNSRIFRIRPHPAELDYESSDKQDVLKWKGELGEAKWNGRWKYNAAHVKGINGIAWDGELSRNSLEQIHLDEDKRRSPKYPTCYVRVIWTIDGQEQTSWETRTTMRRIWKKESADKQIWECAKHYQSRFDEWQGGSRDRSSLSPTPFRRQSTPERKRSKTPRRVRYASEGSGEESEDIKSDEDGEYSDGDEDDDVKVGNEIDPKLLEAFQKFLIHSQAKENASRKEKKKTKSTNKRKYANKPGKKGRA